MSEKGTGKNPKEQSRKVQDMIKGNGKKKEPKKGTQNGLDDVTPYRRCGEEGDFPDGGRYDALLCLSHLLYRFQLLKNRGLIDWCVALCPSPSSVFSVLRTPDSRLHPVLRSPYDDAIVHFRLSRVWRKLGPSPYLGILVSL